MVSDTKGFLSPFLNGKFEKRMNLKGLPFYSVRRILIAVEILLVVVLASILADVTWQFFSTENNLSNSVSRRTASVNPSNDDLLYGKLHGLHLFGEPLSETAKPERALDPRSIPRSRLQARITGILAHPDQSRSLAIIENNRQEDSYRIGDRIHRTSADIEMIYHDRVVVSNNGQQEALLLYPNEPDRPAPSKPAAMNQDAKQVREQLLENPQSLMELVSISPVRDGSGLKGYRINPRQNPELFESLGLKRNDLAVTINGFDLTNNQEAMQVFSELPEARQIVLTVEREQQLVNIEISL